MSPRCGKPMRRYETALSGAVLEVPLCGRPAGHSGRCRSKATVARNYARDARRITETRRRRRERCLSPSEPGSLRLAPESDGERSMITPDDRTAEDMLREVIELLAGAYADSWAHARNAGQVPGVSRFRWRLRRAEPMRATAIDLARCFETRDGAGADRLLSARRTVTEWRQLALLLASAADLERLAPSGPAKPERRAA